MSTTEIKLHKTTNKGLKLLALTIPFVVIGIWMINKESINTTNYIMGWICTCFFGLGIPIGLFHIFDKRPQIIINEIGVWDRTTNQEEIKWEQIIEAYPLDIFDQKFISLVTDDSYIFKKKTYKWASKINKAVGAQQLNLQLGQINIDENQLTELINKLCKARKEDRIKIIKEFKHNINAFPKINIHKILLYISISIGLLLLSINSLVAFMTIMIATGIGGLIARWFSGSNNKSKLYEYSKLAAYFGLVNMTMVLLTFKTYEYTTNNVGLKITTEIENYKTTFDTYPQSLEPINEKLNIIQKYFSNKIVYTTTGSNYKLQLSTLNNKQKVYNKELNEWK